MPKGGRKGGHKGRARQYTSPEEIDAQLQAEKQKAREEEEQGEEDGDGAAGDPKKEKKSLDSDESEDEDDDYQQKRKGVEGLIDIENPNRVAQTTKKVTQLDLDGPKELSRREREEIEKQKAKERYMKMHLAGKTEQAKADLARLAIIRKQREEAAKKKDAGQHFICNHSNVFAVFRIQNFCWGCLGGGVRRASICPVDRTVGGGCAGSCC
uniref:PDGFA associated protein 1 n=2 Tax=Pipistrellus kuhlii TaxID=59472 RepID=A0A7J7YYD8_PIPKU|nr:PDGFA associated protein 1 [Pipistrellus kuhlii]